MKKTDQVAGNIYRLSEILLISLLAAVWFDGVGLWAGGEGGREEGVVWGAAGSVLY